MGSWIKWDSGEVYRYLEGYDKLGKRYFWHRRKKNTGFSYIGYLCAIHASRGFLSFMSFRPQMNLLGNGIMPIL